jgi:hypothetical protein
MTPPLRSELEADAARELQVRALSRSQISCAVEAIARLEQVRRQIRPANVDTKALDQAASLDDGPAGLPERTTRVRARLGLTFGGETECAPLGFDLAHAVSLHPRRNSDIRPATDCVAAIY